MVTGVPDHRGSCELAGAGETTQTSRQKSLTLLFDWGTVAPPKMVATTCCGFWNIKPVFVGGVSVIIVGLVVFSNLIVVFHQDLDQTALREVVTVSLTPLAIFPLARGQCAGVSAHATTIRSLLSPLCGGGGDNLAFVLAKGGFFRPSVCFGEFKGGPFFGRIAALGAALGPDTLVC